MGPPESLISPSGLCGPQATLTLSHGALCWASKGPGSYKVDGENA